MCTNNTCLGCNDWGCYSQPFLASVTNDETCLWLPVVESMYRAVQQLLFILSV